MDRRTLAAKMYADIGAELARSRFDTPAPTHLFAHLADKAGDLAGALMANKTSPAITGANEVYHQALQVAVAAIRVATEGDAAFPYNPAEVTANVD